MPSKKSSRVPRNPKSSASNRRPANKTDLLFQFKITLHESKPPIWRRSKYLAARWAICTS